MAKVLNQHFYKLLSIHRLEGGDIYIYISEGVRSFEERGKQDDGGHNFTTAILSASNVRWEEWWQSITFIVESVLSRSDIHFFRISRGWSSRMRRKGFLSKNLTFRVFLSVCNNYILDPSFSLLLSTKNNNYNLTQLLSTFSRKQV